MKKNRFHPINIPLPQPRELAYDPKGLPFVQGDVRVPEAFHLTGIAAHYRVTGLYPGEDPENAAGGTFTVGEPSRIGLIDYTWRMLDTNLNREFTSSWAPASLLCPGDSGPFCLDAADSLFAANTLIRVFIRVHRMADPLQEDAQFGVTNITRHALQVVLHGYTEVVEQEEAPPPP